MRKNKSKRMSNSNSHSSPINQSTPCCSTYKSTRRSKEKKRKHSFGLNEDSLILLSVAERNIVHGSLPKRQKTDQNLSPMTSEWNISERNDNNKESFIRSSDSFEEEDDDDGAKSSSSTVSSGENDDENFNARDSYKMEHSNEIITVIDVDEVAAHESDSASDESDNNLIEQKGENVAEVPKPQCERFHNKHSSYRILPLATKNIMVLLLNHPTSIVIYKYVSINVLSGNVSICGTQLRAGGTLTNVYSSEKTQLLRLQTQKSENIWNDKDSCKILKQNLECIIGDKKKSQRMMEHHGDDSVLIVVSPCPRPAFLQFLELYYPTVFEFKTKILRGCYYVDNQKNALQFSNKADRLAYGIISAYRSAKLRNSGVRVLIYGPKNSGKSSLLRYLMNKILSVFSSAFYLDTDPGQPEFTPPGVVSLINVKKPVLGPTFCHLRKPVSMVFTGSVTPATSLDIYHRSIYKLQNFYENHFSEEILFVNTMGWIQGLGLECLKNIMKIVKPTMLVKIVTEDDSSMFDYREYVTSRTQFHQIQCQFTERQRGYSAQELREMSVTAYFGKCQLPYLQPKYMNDLYPYVVNWDKIAIYVFGTRIVPHKLVEAVNASVVALCRVDESLILESDIPDFQKTLEDEPDNECLGFGFVRSVDLTNRLLHIVTPVKFKHLAKVNAIIKGKIMTPPPLILNQPIVGVRLPFTDERIIKKKCGIDVEITEAYGKIIPKRQGRTIKK